MRTLPVLLIAATTALALAGCGGGTQAPSTVTVTAPAPAPASSTASSTAPVTQVTLPEVAGQNGSLAYEQLTELGLTNIRMASQDTEDKVVLNPANWTVVEIAPEAGTVVNSGSTIVVTMTKQQ